MLLLDWLFGGSFVTTWHVLAGLLTNRVRDLLLAFVAAVQENIFYADDDPVHRVTTYIPWSIAKGTGLLEEEVPHAYGIHGVLEDQHHTMTRLHEEVSARMPRPDESRYLRLRPGVPVLDVWHTSIDQDGEPYELTQFVMRGDMTGLVYDVPVE